MDNATKLQEDTKDDDSQSLIDQLRDDLCEFHADHLFLLIGGNPLPNVVAACLLAPYGRLTLVCSKGVTRGRGGTESYAQNLRSFLIKVNWPQEKISLLVVEEWNGNNIKHEIAEAAKTSVKNNARENINVRLGLHYTGGTKAMAVHAHEALKEVGGEDVVFSYLDARRMQLVIDQGDNPPKLIPTDRLIKLKLQDLYSLHGQTTMTQIGDDTSVLGNAALELAVANSKDPIFWDSWMSANIRNSAIQEKFWKYESWRNVRPTEFCVDWPVDLLSGFTAALQEATGTDRDSVFDIAKVAKGANMSSKSFLQWLCGMWLESAVMQSLINIRDIYGLHEIRCNVKPWVIANKGKDFELDVIAMRGYQLFAFSCGTAKGTAKNKIAKKGSEGELKLKLFEVDARAQQIGGSQARVALICRHKFPDVIENEAATLLDNGDRIKVFGCKHLADLSKYFGEWIEAQCHGN